MGVGIRCIIIGSLENIKIIIIQQMMIKFFYFTLFKKNGFLFMIVCCILFKDCFAEFILFLFKSAITFYLILCLIYTIFYVRKHIRIGVRILYRTPTKLYPILFILVLIYLNILLN